MAFKITASDWTDSLGEPKEIQRAINVENVINNIPYKSFNNPAYLPPEKTPSEELKI